MVGIDISVVIPCWNGAEPLSLMLRCLARQTLDTRRFEVIVSDDGSSPSLASLLRAGDYPFRLRVVTLRHTGNRALVRNAGAAEASGALLVFMDSDMLAEPGLLDAHRRAAGEGVVSLGVRMNLRPLSQPRLAEVLELGAAELSSLPASEDERGFVRTYRSELSQSLLGNWHLLYSHNFCVSRADFGRSGGFDKSFGDGWGAEDIELGYRLTRAGCSLRLVDEARAYQVAHDADLIRNVRSLRRNLDLFFERHPHWTVELHRYEYEMWFTEYADLLSRVARWSDRNARLAPPALTAVEALDPSEGPVLFIGFPAFESSDANAAFVFPRRDASAGNQRERNLLGTALTEGASHYATCIINASLQDVSSSLFQLIEREAGRVARRVVRLDSRLGPTPSPRDAAALKPFLFTLSDACAESRERDDFFRLAIALHEQGAHVGLQFASDPFSVQARYAGFGGSYTLGERQALDQLFDHDLNLLGEDVLAVMSPSLASWTNRSVDNRAVWPLSEPVDSAGWVDCLRGSAEAWLSHERGYALSAYPSRIVRAGVWLDKFQGIGPKADGPWTLLWCSHMVNAASGLMEAIAAFHAAFADAGPGDVRFRILCDDLLSVPPRSGRGENSACRRQLRAEACARQDELERYLDAARALAALDPRIQCEFGDHSQGDLATAVAHCDALLCTDSSGRISPFVMEALCLGKRPLVARGDAYRGLIDDADITSLDASDAWPLQLTTTLRQRWQTPASNLLSREVSAAYAQTCDWRTIASQLLEALRA